jgi:hypothetical protein
MTMGATDVDLWLGKTSPVRALPDYAGGETTGARAPESLELLRKMVEAVLPRAIVSGFVPPSGIVIATTVRVAPPPMLPADRLAFIEQWLSLSVTQLARILGVGRQTIYRWRENGPLRPENARRLAALWEVAQLWVDRAGVPLGQHATTPLARGGLTLLDLLARPDWDRHATDNALEQLVASARAEHEARVANPVERLAARMDAVGATAPSEYQRAVNRAGQLRRRGGRG